MEEKLQEELKVCWTCSYLISCILCITMVMDDFCCLIKYVAHDHVL